MHHIYTSKSIILKREPSNDSAYFYILTTDLGLITARAQGVRMQQSKLKGTLQEFSLATVAFVHGKSGWKITTAIPEKNFWMQGDDQQANLPSRSSGEARKVMALIAATLIRLITGEEKNTKIFSVVEVGFSLLSEHTEDTPLIEAVMLTRILHALGLLPSDEHTEMILRDFSDFSSDIMSHTRIHKSYIVRAINQGFVESQL